MENFTVRLSGLLGTGTWYAPHSRAGIAHVSQRCALEMQGAWLVSQVQSQGLCQQEAMGRICLLASSGRLAKLSFLWL